VRLDHLLSKEHLPAKVGQEPAIPMLCGVGVARWRRHWRVNIGNGHTVLVRAFRGVGTGGVVRLVVAMGTLLGPEETITPVRRPVGAPAVVSSGVVKPGYLLSGCRVGGDCQA
jgi:hypothetical protein